MKAAKPSALRYNRVRIQWDKTAFFKQFDVFAAPGESDAYKIFTRLRLDGAVLSGLVRDQQVWLLAAKGSGKDMPALFRNAGSHVDASLALQLALNAADHYPGRDDLLILRDGVCFMTRGLDKEAKLPAHIFGVQYGVYALPVPGNRGENLIAAIFPHLRSFRRTRQAYGGKPQEHVQALRPCPQGWEFAGTTPRDDKDQKTIHKGPSKANDKEALAWAISGAKGMTTNSRGDWFVSALAALANRPFSDWFRIEAIHPDAAGIKRLDMPIAAKPAGRVALLRRACERMGVSALSVLDVRANQDGAPEIIKAFEMFFNDCSWPMKVIARANVESARAAACPVVILADPKPETEDVEDAKVETETLLCGLPTQAITNPSIYKSLWDAAEAGDLGKSVPPTMRVLLSELVVKREVLDGGLIMERGWGPEDAVPYLLCRFHAEGKVEKPVAVGLNAAGRLMFFKGGAAIYREIERRKKEERRQCRLVWLDELPDTPQLKDGALLIQDHHLRVMPRKITVVDEDTLKVSSSGWSELNWVNVDLALSGYWASTIDKPNGSVRGICVRLITDKGNPASEEDTRAIARLCVDPFVKGGSATVVPGLFKHLREWLHIGPNS